MAASAEYARTPISPGSLGYRNTAITTTVWIDVSALQGRFLEVVCVSGSAGLNAALVPTGSTALDVANTTGFEVNVPKTIPENQSDPGFFVQSPPKGSAGRLFLALRAGDGATAAHAEVHVR
jgi:hypothetical protein